MNSPIAHMGAAALMAALFAGSVAAQTTTAPASTSTTGQVLDSAGRMVQQPLRDLNIVRDGIPAEIEAIMAEPYSLKGLRGCPDYAREIARLTAVLGPDVDSPEAKASDQTSTEFVLGTAESVVSGLIPGMGIIRRVSGAQAAQRRAEAAVLAGQLRRAFLKGRASGRNCRA
jgi:hypothetical protein